MNDSEARHELGERDGTERDVKEGVACQELEERDGRERRDNEGVA